MPYKVSKPCRYPGCIHTTLSTIGYCESHAHFYQPPERSIDTRPSAAARGYNNNWQQIRAEVLRNAGIPKDQWPLYDVHHTPEYNPKINPNHRDYTLTPLLHEDHSRETGRSRGRGSKSLQDSSRDRRGQSNFSTSEMGERSKNGR